MVDLVLVALPNLILSDPKMYFPLGILYLAAVVEKAGFTVEIADLRDGGGRIPDARFYGFSCTTPEITAAKKIAKQVKGMTIVGGAHATLQPLDCLESFNYIVTGEGEGVILRILNDEYSFGRPKGGALIHGSRIKDLNEIPYPAWDKVDAFSETLFPGERYGTGEKAMTLITSRGCPFSCSFCGNIHKAPVVYRSVGNIMGEIKELKKRGVTHFRFEDDNFIGNPESSILYGALADQHIRYKCHLRSDLFRATTASYLRWSGCEECGLGVESADDKVLEINNKKETAEQHKKAIAKLKEAGVRVKTYFIAGLPGETDETLEINKQFFRECKPDKWTLSTFTPYPGCDIYKNPDKYDIEITDWDYEHWWNFCDDHFVHKLKLEPQEKTWQRYKDFYTWLREEDWKKTS